jgi:hypothetical protein
MGDTLKDCCHVLGATICLRKSYDMVAQAMAKPQPSWQEIEAPLFSMRSMGAEVDNDDENILPHIMDMLPRLPEHPRIRYAAILVISRYTQWINRHPANLAFQLQYVSAGFELADEMVSAAAAQAMKFMCQDCHTHLVPFLGQLHTFVTTVGDKLEQADMVEVSEAIGYVISSMPAEEGAGALQQFSQDLLQRVQAVAVEENPGKDGLMKAAGKSRIRAHESELAVPLLTSRRSGAARLAPHTNSRSRTIPPFMPPNRICCLPNSRYPTRPSCQDILHFRTCRLHPSTRITILPARSAPAGGAAVNGTNG